MRTSYKAFSCCFALVALSIAASCSSDSSKAGGASVEEVEECQDACDQQRFFDCYDAQLHAGCFDDCSAASSDEIVKFDSCVRTADFCDAECSTHIKGKSAEVPEEDQVETGRDPAPAASSCETACQALVSDMCIQNDCSPLCAESEELRFGIVYCNSVREGCDFPSECTGELSPEDGCLAGCDQLQFFGCIEATDATQCRTACTTADDATKDSFGQCVQGSSEICDENCYTILNPDGPSADVSGCQDSCDNLEFYDCVDAQGLSDCRETCTQASRDAVETFKSCAQGICDDDSCYQVLLNSL